LRQIKAGGAAIAHAARKERTAMDEDNNKNRWKTFTEEIEIAGSQLVDRVTQLIRDGNVRLLRIRSENGDIFLEIPLTVGAVTGGVVALAAPWLAVLGALAGLLAKVRIEIVRQEEVKPGEEEGDDEDEDDIPTV